MSRLYPDRPFLAASFAVFREDRVLLGSRATPPNDALYSIPGGVVEAGETREEAALRELFEETGGRAQSLAISSSPPSRGSGFRARGRRARSCRPCDG